VPRRYEAKGGTMQITLYLAAAYNILGGLTILFLMRAVGPLIHFQDYGPPLFRLFAGGTAVLFGAAYVAIATNFDANRKLLVCGTVLKYWAFAISLWLFVSSGISIQVLAAFGGGNLVLALLFTYFLWRGDAAQIARWKAVSH
jgi:hypothetical protein